MKGLLLVAVLLTQQGCVLALGGALNAMGAKPGWFKASDASEVQKP